MSATAPARVASASPTRGASRRSRRARRRAGRDARVRGRRARPRTASRWFDVGRRPSRVPHRALGHPLPERLLPRRGGAARGRPRRATSSALRFRAYTRPPAQGRGAAAAGRGPRAARARQPAVPARTRTTSPGPNLLEWRGDVASPSTGRRRGPAVRDRPSASQGGEVHAERHGARGGGGVPRHVRPDRLRLGGGGAGRPERRQQRRLPLDQHRLGPRRDHGRLRRRRGVSGAHLNPAVTLAAGRAPRVPVGKVLPYVAAQIAGAFTGAARRSSSPTARPSTASTAASARSRARRRPRGSSPPTRSRSSASPAGFVDQVVGTALLIAASSSRSATAGTSPPRPRFGPVLVGAAGGADRHDASASTPATPSTPRATSARACSRRRRLGRRGLPRRQRLVVGADRGPAASARVAGRLRLRRCSSRATTREPARQEAA